jgi:cytochrome c oxidase subunit 4
MADRRKPHRSFWQINRDLLITWACLCVLLAMTCALAYVPLGRGNLPVSLVIAAIKGTLVGAVFMHLSEHNALNRLAACVGPIWVFIMFVLLGADYFTR